MWSGQHLGTPAPGGCGPQRGRGCGDPAAGAAHSTRPGRPSAQGALGVTHEAAQ